MRRATLLLISLFLAAPALAQEVVSSRVAVFEAGILCAPDSVGTREAPGTVAGTTHIVEETPPFVDEGRMVPAVLGVGFGVRAGFDSSFGEEDILIRVTHPPFAGTGATEQSFFTYIGGLNDPAITFYQFDYDYELALGTWTFEALSGDDLIYRTVWTVVPPNTLPELAGICGYMELLG